MVRAAVEPGSRPPRRPRCRYGLLLLGVVGLALLVVGCARDAPQDVLRPAGPVAQQQDDLFRPIFWFAVVPVFVLVQGLVVVTVIRHRHRPGRPEPKQVHGNTRLEIAWTVGPAVILLFVAVPTIATIFDLDREPVDPLEVNVYGHLWWWEYEYPEQGVVTANELVIPAGRPVRLSMEAIAPGLPAGPGREVASGVIHSYWVPRLAGKQDVVPGRVNRLTIEADEPGTYLGQCAEYCNLSHANMRLAVVAKEPGEFEAWVAAQREPAPEPATAEAREGLEIFTGRGGCVACHAVGGIEGAVSRTGPNLTHLMSRARFAGYVFDTNRENLIRWVSDPPAMKPMRPEQGTGMPDMGLSDEEVAKVVAYLETLG